jgi:hypothetical protein
LQFIFVEKLVDEGLRRSSKRGRHSGSNGRCDSGNICSHGWGTPRCRGHVVARKDVTFGKHVSWSMFERDLELK